MKLQVCPSTQYGRDLKMFMRVLRTPLYLTIVQGETYLKRCTVRPLTLLLVAVVIIIAAFMWCVPQEQLQNQQHIAQLQYEQRHLTSKLSATEARLALRDSELASMQQELTRNAHDMHAMQQRLDMFEDVLAARKVKGWHILHPTATWQDERTIAYQLVVVKGENYPRWAKGYVSFSVLDAQGKTVVLANKAGKRTLKFDMTTHAFFEGEITWSRDWHAKILIISLFDKRGKNNQKIEIPILNVPAN